VIWCQSICTICCFHKHQSHMLAHESSFFKQKEYGMKEAFVKLTKKPFVRHVAIVATGTAAAQAVTMLLSPLITRLYGPQAYGLMGLFAAIVGIIAPIAALTYSFAIVFPNRNSDAR